MKKGIFILAFALCTAWIAAGCAALPKKYTESIQVPAEFPQDDIGIYENAVVYEINEDDDKIELKFGSADSASDIANHYKGLFDDNELTIDNMYEGENVFHAKGTGGTYQFEISAEPAKVKHEQRAFETVVRIIVRPYVMGDNTLERMQGFWYVSNKNGIVSDDVKDTGYALNIDGKTIDAYKRFIKVLSNSAFEFVSENEIEVDNKNESELTINIEFETVDDKDVMTLNIDGNTISYIKSSYNEMMENKPAVDNQLIDDMQGFWLFCGYDGHFADEYRGYGWGVNFDDIKMDAYTGGIIDFYGVEFAFIDDNTIIYFNNYNNETTFTLYVEEYEGKEYLTFIMEGRKHYYERSNIKDMLMHVSASNSSSGSDVLYLTDALTDADLLYLITDRNWSLSYYLETDGSHTQAEEYNRKHFNKNNTAEDEYDSEHYDITWEIAEGLLYLYYDNKPTEVYYIDFEYDGHSWHLHLFDEDKKYSDRAYVYAIDPS